MFKKLALALLVLILAPFLNPDFRHGFVYGFKTSWNEEMDKAARAGKNPGSHRFKIN